MEIGIITNPNSRKNRGRPQRAETLQQIIGDHGEVHQTASPEAVKPVLRRFLRRGIPLWVSDGGDGALHWMLRHTLEVLREDEFASRVGPLPLALPTNGGTIDFVAGNVGIKGNAESILTRLREKIERGEAIDTVEVKSMAINGVEVTDAGERPFEALGFASAVGGIGQRFFAKYYEADDPCPQEIVKVVAKTVASFPVATTALKRVPGMPSLLRNYADEMFRPTAARVTLDGTPLPHEESAGINVASMAINLGNVMRFFAEADQPNQLHALVGSPPPWQVIRNLPRMYLGKRLVGDNLYDGACKELTVEATGSELLAPIIDGECYRNLRQITFRIGPRLSVPKVVAKRRLLN